MYNFRNSYRKYTSDFLQYTCSLSVKIVLVYILHSYISSAALYNRRGYFSSAFRRDCSRHRSAYGMRARKETKKCETCRRSRYEGQKKIPSHLSIATRRASDWLASLPLSLRLSRARKLGAPRRNLKKVVRLPALSFTVASKSVHERARASRRDATRASRERISEVDDHSVVAARKSPSKVARGVIEADRERQRRGERGRGEGRRERESISRAHLLRPDIDLAAAASLSAPASEPSSNTFRRNRDFSQSRTRAGERERGVREARGAAIHHGYAIASDIAGFLLVYIVGVASSTLPLCISLLDTDKYSGDRVASIDGL